MVGHPLQKLRFTAIMQGSYRLCNPVTYRLRMADRLKKSFTRRSTINIKDHLRHRLGKGSLPAFKKKSRYYYNDKGF